MTILLLVAGITYEIQGEGFFRFESEDGIVYSRTANLHAANGYLVNEDGLRISPPVRVTPEWRIEKDGRVVCGKKTVGELVLAKLNGAKAVLGNAGCEGFGTIILRASSLNTPISIQSTPITSSESAGTKITVRPLSEINGPEITLGQVADITANELLKSRLENVSLGDAPKVGETRLITQTTILGALRAAHIDSKAFTVSVPTKALVHRASHKITGAELEQFARDWIAKNIPAAAALTLTTQAFERNIPEGELSLKVTNHRELGTAVIVTVEATVNATRVFATQLVFNASVADGKSEGAVKAGQTVRVVLLSNGVTVETTGKTQSSGVVGGNITVLIEDTKATVIGTLRADGIVEVKL